MRCAVIGSTGYVGVRLVARLLREGHEVTALVRTPAKLATTGWAEQVDVVPGDLDDLDALDDRAPFGGDAALDRLCAGADVVYVEELQQEAGRRYLDLQEKAAAALNG